MAVIAVDLPLPIVLASMRACAKGGAERAFDRLARLESIPFWQRYYTRVEDDEGKIDDELSLGKILGGSQTKRFFYLPFAPNEGNFLIGLFRPTFRVADNECDLEIILVSSNNCDTMGFRLERGLEHEDMHGYSHIQLTRKFRREPIIETSLPQCFDLSYPAFPLPRHISYSTWPIALGAFAGLPSGARTKGLGAELDKIADQLEDDQQDAFAVIHSTAMALFYG